MPVATDKFDQILSRSEARIGVLQARFELLGAKVAEALCHTSGSASISVTETDEIAANGDNTHTTIVAAHAGGVLIDQFSFCEGALCQ